MANLRTALGDIALALGMKGPDPIVRLYRTRRGWSPYLGWAWGNLPADERWAPRRSVWLAYQGLHHAK